MQDRNPSIVRRSIRRAILPAVALAALIAGLPAGLPAAQAADQQATGAQMDNALNWAAVSGTGVSGAYAQAPVQPHRTTPRAHRSYR